jgi:hypothetical protein
MLNNNSVYNESRINQNENIELFKKALAEGVSKRIDRTINACKKEDFVCSEKHKAFMNYFFKDVINSQLTPFPNVYENKS